MPRPLPNLRVLFPLTGRRTAPLAMILLFGTATIFSQTPAVSSETVAVSGKITDRTGTTLAQANITLESTSNRTLRTTTDSTGHFRLDALPGEYTLRVTSPGFQNYEHRSIHLLDGKPLAENIVLEIGGVCSPCLSIGAEFPLETLNSSLTSTIPLLPLPPLKLPKSPAR